jgi:hypothetical protein
LFAVRLGLFSLEIKVEGDTESSVIKWDVEIGAFSVDLLMQTLTNQFKWSPSHKPCVWFFDKLMCEDVRLYTDFQLQHLFEMYKDQMHCQLVVGFFERTIADVDENATIEPIIVIPSADNQDVEPNVHDNPIPEPAEPDGGQEYPPEPELEPDREPDMFDNEEEYVGVDDELMYMPVPQTQATNHDMLLITMHRLLITMHRLLMTMRRLLIIMLMKMMLVLLKEVIL